ncbi:MAG: DUF1302 domain-containing protein [Halioglobus sp.]|nr:DUF1302 domain-containing protein [Halioglobus sp.]
MAYSRYNSKRGAATAALSGGALLALALCAGAPQVLASDMDVAGFVENATYYRESRGISKSRNTAQVEFGKDISGAFKTSRMTFNATLRATYDAVYELNDGEWGENAGGPITLANGTFGGRVPHGGGLKFAVGGVPTGLPPTLGFPPSTDFTPFFGGPASPNAMFGLPNVVSMSNPNEGLEMLGGHLSSENGGIAFGVPVRPCDIDRRGCKPLEDYMDLDESEMAWSDFNDRWDFIREFYLSGSFDLANDDQVGFKVGKQQIIWGRTDLFRVLDVINPVDYSRNNIYDELEDIRIPMWMAELEYRWGATEFFGDINLSFVWNFDKFRPSNLGQAGQPYQILDAGSFFRGMANCWENGCTVSNFPVPAPGGGLAGLGAVDFGPGVIGIRDVKLPEWNLSNTQFGIKLEGVKNEIGFSLNFLETRQQLPVLRGHIPSIDPFNPFVIDDYDYALAFDIEFPRVTLIGGSLDLYWDAIKSAFRIELAHTDGEEFADTSVPDLYSESDVVRWVVGWDRSTFIPFLNKDRAFLISAQAFGQHLLDHNEHIGAVLPGLPPPGKVGMADHENNYLFTLLIQGWYMNDRLNPQIIMAHDYESGHTTIAPAIEWLLDNHWQFTLRANYKIDDGVSTWDDDRASIPYPGLSAALTGGATTGLAPTASNGGLRGANPLGRFADGPLGMAQEEDEIQITVRYRF